MHWCRGPKFGPTLSVLQTSPVPNRTWHEMWSTLILSPPTCGPIHSQGLAFIPTWISNYIPSKVWKILLTVEVWEFHLTFCNRCNYLSLLLFKLIRVSKRGPWHHTELINGDRISCMLRYSVTMPFDSPEYVIGIKYFMYSFSEIKELMLAQIMTTLIVFINTQYRALSRYIFICQYCMQSTYHSEPLFTKKIPFHWYRDSHYTTVPGL